MNHIGFKLHKLILNKNYNEINNILLINDLDILLDNNGCLSNILLFYIYLNDNDNITKILSKNNLMKRDYLNIAKFYYNINYEKSLEVFKKINYHKLNNTDIDFLINNLLIKLLYELDELFIYSKIKSNNLINLPYNKLLINNSKLIDKIEELIKPNYIYKLNQISNKYKFIIDAGNILYSYQGKINKNSLDGLEKIINNCKECLIIIHEKHFKNELIKNLIYKYDYFLTPYKYNDDLFILWLFLKFNIEIITNDKFKDHNYNFNFEYNYNILLQYIINYSPNYDLIYKEYNYIKKINNKIYIPQEDGNYLFF